MDPAPTEKIATANTKNLTTSRRIKTSADTNLPNDAVQAMRIGAAMTRNSDTTVFMSTMNLPMLVIVAWQMAAMQLFIICFKPSIAAIEHTMPMAFNQNVGLWPQTRM